MSTHHSHHEHAPAPSRPNLGASLLNRSAGQRLLAVVPLLLLLWLAVLWTY